MFMRLAMLRARSALRDTNVAAEWWASQRNCDDGGTSLHVGRSAATLTKPPRWDRGAAEHGKEKRCGAAFLAIVLAKRRGNNAPLKRCRAHARHLRSLAMTRARSEATRRDSVAPRGLRYVPA